MAGFFGYGLGVEARYRQLLAIRRYRNLDANPTMVERNLA
jgi:hypothetical protein